jgi:hypothetical protein
MSLRDATAGLPRLTVTMNKSKRRLVKALDDLLESYETGERLIRAMKTAIPPHGQA